MEPATNPPPAWLDKEFVETLLRENEDPSITVSDIAVKVAVGKGENYMSQLHRVGVDLTRDDKSEHLSLIVKSLPPTDFMAKMLVEGGFFERETRMYQETFPVLYGLEEAGLGGAVPPISARCYKTSRPSTIVLEDLAHRGFKMAARHRGLDLLHTKLALRAFARLHALSTAQAAKDPSIAEQYPEPFHKEELREKNAQFFTPMMNLLAGNVEKWDGYQRFGDKLRNIDWVDCGIRMAKVNEGDPTVLNHGDGWTNNLLFQYGQDGIPAAVVLVDFQVARFASPALDLQYFMHTSPHEDVRENHWDEVIQDYYHTFVEVLKGVSDEVEPISYDTLNQEVEKKMMFGLLTACSILPIVLVDAEDAPEMSNITEDNFKEHIEASNMHKSYNSKRFVSVFGKLLLKFERMGLLE